ncbi:hypothetical protein ACEPPN_001934 [Leptodophora sp. 'Broadleaf-Isolate-01']
MSRNTGFYHSPLAHRGRSQYDHRLAAADFLADNRYPHFGPPGRYIPFYPEFYDIRDCSPPGNFGNGDGRPEPQALKPAFRNPRPRPNMSRQGKEGQPTGKAMKKLHKILTAAEQTYSAFQDEFDSEIEPIKKYATPESMVDRMWNMKFNGKKGSTDNEDAPEKGEKFATKHNDAVTKLGSALSDAVHSTDGQGRQSRKSKHRAENADRLREKVETASSQIMSLLKKLPDDREYCASLLGELKLLIALVDPDEATNVALYKSGDADEDGASDAEGDEEEQGGRGNDWQS